VLAVKSRRRRRNSSRIPALVQAPGPRVAIADRPQQARSSSPMLTCLMSATAPRLKGAKTVRQRHHFRQQSRRRQCEPIIPDCRRSSHLDRRATTCGRMCRTGLPARSSLPMGPRCQGRPYLGRGGRHGPRQHRRWGIAWSPQQIAERLRLGLSGRRDDAHQPRGHLPSALTSKAEVR